jgi:hypothetical protein
MRSAITFWDEKLDYKSPKESSFSIWTITGTSILTRAERYIWKRTCLKM